MAPHLVYNFYCFVENLQQNLATICQEFTAECKKRNLLGTILLAPEGANFGLSGSEAELDSFVAYLRTHTEFNDFILNKSWGYQKPFPRLKVKLQEAVLTFTTDDDPTSAEIKSGKRLAPKEWNEVLQSEDVIVLDTRNDYEMEWGKFKTAESLHIDNFSEFPEKFKERFADKPDQKILMYCTGGIRCEKAVAWATKHGFTNTYQLDGGIVKYLEEFGAAKDESASQYEGACFVFDRRWALDGDREEVHTPDKNLEVKEQPKQFFDSERLSHFAID